MEWSKDVIAGARERMDEAGEHADTQDVTDEMLAAIMTHAGEVLAARGGVLGVDALLHDVLEPLPPSCWQPAFEHFTAQGARIAAMEQENADRQGQIDAQAQHISDLEKSLDNARDERNRLETQVSAAARQCEALRNERDEWQQAHADTQRLYHGAENRCTAAQKERDAASAELARLKPSGQVAEDVGAVRSAMLTQSDHTGVVTTASDALSRIAAKAQGYEAFAAACRAALGPHRSAGTPEDVALLHKDLEASRAFSVQFGQERDAAVADNAALVSMLSRAEALWTASHDLNDFLFHDAMIAIRRSLACKPHPGTALLERMKRLEEALANVGEDGWPKDVLRVDWETWQRMGATARSAIMREALSLAAEIGRSVQVCMVHVVPPVHPGDTVRSITPIVLTTPTYTTRITGISGPTCTDGSCAKCRSGEPCH